MDSKLRRTFVPAAIVAAAVLIAPAAALIPGTAQASSFAEHTGERLTAVTAHVQAKMFPMLRAQAASSAFTGLAARPAKPKLP